MKKLTIDLVAPYIPFDLKFVSSLDNIEGFPKTNKQWTCNGISYLFGDFCLNTYENNDAYPVQSCELILRPLSEYSDIHSQSMYDLNTDILIAIEIEEFSNQKKSLASLSYTAYMELLRANADIFNLITEGLAIDINTL